MLTQERVKELFNYDADKGVLVRIKNVKGSNGIGSIAGSKHCRGYLEVSIDHIKYLVHRVIFLYMVGRFPNVEIDHINLNKLDNRWVNLRECNKSRQKQNCLPIKGKIHSRYKGVSFKRDIHRNKPFRSRIFVNKKEVHLGCFSTELEAAQAYNIAAINHFGEFARINVN